jgi:hypothetical protein
MVQCLFASGLVLALGNISQAVVFNFENDFSKSVNTESSTWSYRWKDSFTRDGVYPLLPVFRTTWASMPYFPTWGPGPIDIQAYPMIGVNDSGAPIYDPVLDPGGLWPWPDGQSDLHPGAVTGTGQDAFAVVSWLSPLSGTVNIEMRITKLDGRGGNGVEYHVDKGSAAGKLVSGTIPYNGDTGFFWIFDVPVSVGDRLNFIIGPNGDDAYNDSTRMFIEIVPEPASLALLALGGTVALLGRKAVNASVHLHVNHQHPGSSRKHLLMARSRGGKSGAPRRPHWCQ